MFTSTLGRGVRLTFPFVEVSVQWGRESYCDARVIAQPHGANAKPGVMWSANTAEVAVWRRSDNKWVRCYPHGPDAEKIDDDVVGHSTLAQVLDILNWAQALTDEPPLPSSDDDVEEI